MYFIFRIVYNECLAEGNSVFEALLEEWGTSGRIRPTIKDLIALLERAKFFKVSEYIKIDILKGLIILSFFL